MNHLYSPPVDQLLSLGETDDPGNFRAAWPDYIHTLGLGDADVPELIRMIADARLYRLDDARSWAPVHAWRSLGQLRATEAIAPLLSLLHTVPDDDYVGEEVPRVLALMGEAALEPLAAYMEDPAHGLFPRAGASEALVGLARTSPSSRDAVVAVLAGQLSNRATASPDLNSFIVANLADLNAVEVAPIIERAFADDLVEWEVCGDWEDVQVDLGLMAQRVTPRPSYAPRAGSQLLPASAEPGGLRYVGRQPPAAQSKKKKKRARHRMAKASRRRNRRKK